MSQCECVCVCVPVCQVDGGADVRDYDGTTCRSLPLLEVCTKGEKNTRQKQRKTAETEEESQWWHPPSCFGRRNFHPSQQHT